MADIKKNKFIEIGVLKEMGQKFRITKGSGGETFHSTIDDRVGKWGGRYKGTRCGMTDYWTEPLEKLNDQATRRPCLKCFTDEEERREFAKLADFQTKRTKEFLVIDCNDNQTYEILGYSKDDAMEQFGQQFNLQGAFIVIPKIPNRRLERRALVIEKV